MGLPCRGCALKLRVCAARLQAAAAAAQQNPQQPLQPARALLSVVQQYVSHLAAHPPAAAAAPRASLPYVLPEGAAFSDIAVMAQSMTRLARAREDAGGAACACS